MPARQILADHKGERIASAAPNGKARNDTCRMTCEVAIAPVEYLVLVEQDRIALSIRLDICGERIEIGADRLKMLGEASEDEF